MASGVNLEGSRIAALAADGFEKVELTVPMRALPLAGANVDVISLRHGRIRGVNLHEPASKVHVDKTVDETLRRVRTGRRRGGPCTDLGAPAHRTA